MATSSNSSFIWIDPKHLTPDELEYELKLRCLDFPGMSLEDQQQALFTEQCKEAQIPKILAPRKTLLEEVGIIEIKLMMIRHELEVKVDKKLITRLKHLYLRLKRIAALDAYQIQMKKELLDEIETLVEVFGSDREQIPREISRRASRNSGNQRGAENVAVRRSLLQRITAYEFPPEERVPRSTGVHPQNSRRSLNPEARAFTPEPTESTRDQLPSPIHPSTTETGVDRQDATRADSPESLLIDFDNEVEDDHASTRRETNQRSTSGEIKKIVEDVLTDKLGAMMNEMFQRFQGSQSRNPEADNRSDNEDRNSVASHPSYDNSRRRALHPNPGLGRNPEIPQQRTGNGNPIDDNFPPRRENVEGRIPNQRGVERQSKVPIDKWPVRFSGDPRGPSVEEFLKRVETLANNNRTTEAELLGQVNFLFRPDSAAEEWYYTYSSKFTTWKIFKYMLKLRFGMPNTDRVTEKQIRDRRQLPQETFIAFVAEIERLAQKLTKPLDEKYKLNIILENMRDCYRPHLAFIDLDHINLDALTSLCFDLDKALYQTYTPKSKTYNVHNLSEGVEPQEDTEESEEEINAVSTHKQKTKQRQEPKNTQRPEEGSSQQNNVLCWNCRQFGHFWRDCTKQKRMFCHICGQINVMIATCPNNHRFATEPKNDQSERS